MKDTGTSDKKANREQGLPAAQFFSLPWWEGTKRRGKGEELLSLPDRLSIGPFCGGLHPH